MWVQVQQTSQPMRTSSAPCSHPRVRDQGWVCACLHENARCTLQAKHDCPCCKATCSCHLCFKVRLTCAQSAKTAKRSKVHPSLYMRVGLSIEWAWCRSPTLAHSAWCLSPFQPYPSPHSLPHPFIPCFSTSQVYTFLDTVCSASLLASFTANQPSLLTSSTTLAWHESCCPPCLSLHACQPSQFSMKA